MTTASSKVVERAIMPQELAKADEVLLTGSAAEVTPVGEIIGQRLPYTLAIALVCHLLATGIGVSLGIVAAMNQHRLGDTMASVLAFLGMTIPRFLMALIILYWLGAPLGVYAGDGWGEAYTGYILSAA